MEYRYIGKPYSFNEIIRYSSFFLELDKYVEYLNKNVNDTKNIISKKLKEECFNDILDLISLIILEKDKKLAFFKIEFIIEKYKISGFLIEVILNVYVYEESSKYLQIEPFNLYDFYKFKNDVAQFLIKPKNEFYSSFEISKEMNVKIVNSLSEHLEKEKTQICNFFEAYLDEFRKNSFKPFKRYETNNKDDDFNFSFDVTSFDYIQPVKFSVSDKVLLFESLMKIQNYESISQRKKASILSLFFNESEETIRTYLRMIDKPSSESNNAFLESRKKIESILKTYKIK